MKYTPMPTPSDLCVATLNYAMGANPPIYLHVHPELAERAREIVDFPAPSGRRIKPEVIVDATLNVNEWYLTSNIGSDPA